MKYKKIAPHLAVAYLVVVATMLYGTASKIAFFHEHQGIVADGSLNWLLWLAVALCLATACLLGNRWAAMIAIGLASFALVGIFSMSSLTFFAMVLLERAGARGELVPDIIAMLGALAWLTLGAGTLRATKAAPSPQDEKRRLIIRHPDSSPVSLIAYCIVIASVLYSTVIRFVYYYDHLGIDVMNSIGSVFGAAVILWIATACYKGARWAGAALCVLGAVNLSGLNTIFLSGIVPSMFEPMGRTYDPMSVMLGKVSMVFWLALGFITLRRTKAVAGPANEERRD